MPETATRQPATPSAAPAVMVVFAVATLLRLAYLGETADSPLFQTVQLDAQWYLESAHRIASGSLGDGRPFFRAPVYPLFLAGVLKLTGYDLVWSRILQHLMGAVSCVLVLLIGRRVYGATTGLLAGLICAVYGPLIYYENEFLIPALAVFVFLLALSVLVDAAERPALWRWFAGGLALGVCAATRPNFLACIPAVMGWWCLAGRRRVGLKAAAAQAAATGVGAVLAILPVTLHNVRSGGEWVLIATQGGINFYIGNNPQSDGKTALAPGGQSPVADHFVDNIRLNAELTAERASGRPLSDGEVSAYWYRRGLDFWRRHPGAALKLTLKKLYYFVNGFEIESNRTIYLDGNWSRLSRALTWTAVIAFPLGVVMPLALLGVFLPAAGRRAHGLMVLLLVFYAMTVIGFFVTGRFRVPLVPLLALLAAHAAVLLYAQLRSKRWSMAALTVPALVVLLAVCNSSAWGVRHVDLPWQYSMIGNAYLRLGELDRAVDMYEKALALDPDSFVCRYNCGLALRNLGQPEAALAHLNRAVRTSHTNANARNLLGLVLQDLERQEAAIEQFELAIDAKPDFAVAHANLGIALLNRDRVADAVVHLQKAVTLQPNHARAHYNLGIALALEGRPAQALAHVKSASELGFAPDPQFEAELRRQVQGR